MSIALEERADGSLALFMDGDLQFDSRDEALYHESLVLPALTIASQKVDSQKQNNLKVLICGGGDGLALRECLRFPGVTAIDLVDYSEEVVSIGRLQLAELNCRSFDDPRVTVHIQDAWEFLANCGEYDVIICDLTVPRRPEETRVFTREWYQEIGRRLTPKGVASINGFSPQVTPEAFWCLHNTIRAADLRALPFRVCIPSFREQGYGVWSFLLATKKPLGQDVLRNLACSVETKQSDISQLFRGAHFSRKARKEGKAVAIHTVNQPCLLPLLLNPNQFHAMGAEDANMVGYDFDPLIAAIPTLHPQHTRDMIESLTKQVAGYVQSIDLKQLVDTLLTRATTLTLELRTELQRLKSWLSSTVVSTEGLGKLSAKLFAVLVITMTLANAVAPDNAFAKGSSGLGHASMSRGFSGGFGGGRGTTSASARGFSATSGSPVGASRSSFNPSTARVTGSGYRSGSYRGSTMTDVYGYTYRPRFYSYYGGYGYGGYGYGHNTYIVHSNRPAPRPVNQQDRHQATFVADEDMLILDNGDIILNVSDEGYLLLSNGELSLMHVNSMEPLAPMAVDPVFHASIVEELTLQKQAIAHEIGARQDWIGWVGWTSALFKSVRDDKTEVSNMQDLTRRIDLALKQVGSAPASPPVKPSGLFTELFVGGYLTDEGSVRISQPNGKWLITDGKTLTYGDSLKPSPCPKELAAMLKSVMVKLQKELTADQSSNKSDLATIAKDRAQLEMDLASYQSIYSGNNFDGTYEVDYGTDSISVSTAISRTQADLDKNKADEAEAIVEQGQGGLDLDRINRLLPYFAPK